MCIFPIFSWWHMLWTRCWWHTGRVGSWTMWWIRL